VVQRDSTTRFIFLPARETYTSFTPSPHFIPTPKSVAGSQARPFLPIRENYPREDPAQLSAAPSSRLCDEPLTSAFACSRST
jgi:hypothetical protein